MDTQSTSRCRRFVNVLVHLLFIVIIFVLPELVMALAMPHRRQFVFYPGLYVKTLILIVVFYLNYFIIIDRTSAVRAAAYGVFCLSIFSL